LGDHHHNQGESVDSNHFTTKDQNSPLIGKPPVNFPFFLLAGISETGISGVQPTLFIESIMHSDEESLDGSYTLEMETDYKRAS
jgi:hypothetical protein